MKRAGGLPSLRGELTRLATMAAVGWLLVLALTVSWAVNHEIGDLMDETLRESAEVMYGVLTVSQMVGGEAALPDVLPAPAHEERMVWQLVNANGRVERRSHKAPKESFVSLPLSGLFDVEGQWRVYGMHIPDGRRMLYVAQVGDERREARYEAIATVLLVAVSVSLVWVVLLRRRVDRAMHPLAQLAAEIESYEPLQPQTEPSPGQRTETAAISVAVLSLGRRLARRIELEQSFAACAAHSLRTPLAGMDAQLALALREPPESLPVRLARVRGALTRLTRVVQSLLALFRAGEAWRLELRHCSLSELVAEIPVQGLEITIEADAVFEADPNLLTIALVNLLDNAVRFEARNVRLFASIGAHSVCIRVEDDGTGMSEARWADVKRALDGGRVGSGLGLGLRLASLVAHAHGGELRLPKPLNGQLGFLVELWLWIRPVQGEV